jgi:lipoprotein-releasing system permease protein
MTFELFVGRRYLGAKRKQAFISLITFLSIAGVAVGVMVLIVVIAVMSGAETDLRSRILGITPHIMLTRQGGIFSEYRKTIEQLKNISGIQAATPYIYMQGMLRSAKGMSGAVIRGIDTQSAGDVIVSLNKDVLEKLAAQKSDNIPGIILGYELAKEILKVDVGDWVSLITEIAGSKNIAQMPPMVRFKVAALFRSGIYDYDKSLAYVQLKDAQNMLHVGDNISGIDIRVKELYEAKNISGKISDKLGYPYWTMDWMRMNRNIFSSLKLQKTVMFIILILIILVAAFNIASALMMTVMEKTKDIAILKAMGATNKSIRTIFVFKGMAIGLVGTMIGLVFGSAVCELLKRYKIIDLPKDVYFFTRLPVSLEIADVTVIALSALLLCFLSTLYPAIRASRLDPIKAIRY